MTRYLLLATVATLSFTLAARTHAATPLLAVSQAGGNPEILLITGDGESRNLTNHPASDSFPAWSPDGMKIAFCSNRDGAPNIYVMNAAGGDVEKVTDLPRGSKAMCFCPSWSPDGESIAYHRREGNESDLYTLELESGRLRKLTDDAWDPAWSPEGDKILFAGRTDKGWSLYTIEPDGAKLTEIVAMEGRTGFIYPAWSPDGKRIAFSKEADGAHEIVVCNADGSKSTQLTKAGRLNTHAAWSSDGKRVAYLHDIDGNKWRWEAVDVETKKSEPLTAVAEEGYLHGGRIAYKPGE